MSKVIWFGKELFTRIGEDDVPGMAAQLAYFFLLSLFPLMIFLITLLGYMKIDEQRVLDFIGTYAPPETYEMISKNVTELLNQGSGGLLSIGILGTLWAASNGVKGLMRALNRAHNVEESRSFIVGRLTAIVLTVAMVLVIAIAFLLPVLGNAIGTYVFSLLGLSDSFIALWSAFRWVISSVIFFIVLSFLYIMAPNKTLRINEIAIGAIFATVGWQLVSLLFSYYVSSLGNYSATYGSLGGVIVLMIWFFLSGLVIILGGEINAVVLKNRELNS
ncbi:YihY/virulence factor BrkB family protein [Halobacillus shinanisalinarum]|uniref:YihY/virulence factor BrkB family protein n=1 Tax=Halobacillus shinanisalinarum TaxID=2932258 RepID=A0ABY4GX61_9BACI|nr:YihY/virulence factor BrkB family protein [Halobacillus shinanisalinarum]UOQ92520.1 YihY/virulence factor BrkB family protein [Halobacillus shinanisalinarum]